MSILGRPSKPSRICPECGLRYTAPMEEFMPAHWRANHRDVMPWHMAEPLLRNGVYVPFAYGKPKPRPFASMPWLRPRSMPATG